MKKMIVGLVMFSVGFLGLMILIASLVCSPQSPWIVNGVEGIYSGIAYMEMQIPVGACVVLSIGGLALALIDAFKQK